MREARRLVVEPWMTHERLDDQVMMINLETGAYFALERPAADCWSALTAGVGFDGIVAEVVAHFDVPPAQAETDVEAFVASLLDEGIVRWSTDHPVEVAPAPVGDGAGSAASTGARLAYRPPQIEKHDDLEELLLLDPIHDVGPEGWPAVS
jgi:hypothetical protein